MSSRQAPTVDTVSMPAMSAHEYRRRLASPDTIVFLPVGATEQHGPHLPIGTDWMMAEYMAKRVAQELSGVVAAPVMYAAKSGVRTGGGNFQCGTTSLDGITLITVVKDILKELVRHGARKIVVMDGHFENRFFLDEACDIAIRELRFDGVHDAKIMKMIYAAEFPDHLIAHIYPDNDFPGLDLEHGGILETSMMLYCFPELVHMDRLESEATASFPPYDLYPPREEWVPASGTLSSGMSATVEKGEYLVEFFVKQATGLVQGEFS